MTTTRGTLTALLAKNGVIKKRHPFATLSEVLNPLLCILLFAALKTLEQDLDVPSGWATATKNESAAALSRGSNWNLFAKQDLLASFLNATSASNNNNNSSSNSPISNLNSNGSSLGAQMGWTSALSLASGLVVPKFYFTETTMPGLLLNLALQSIAEGDRLDELSDLDMLSCFLKFVMLGYTSVSATSLYSVPIECRNKVVPYKIAITPDTVYTRKYFAALLDTWYPRLPLIKPIAGISALQVASFRDSRMFFDNESALEAYITSESYGLDLAHPKIYAAIAFHEFPQQSSDIGDLRGHDIEYSLRLNSTYTDTNFPGSVPRTISRRFNVQKFNKEVKPMPTLCYATRGFMTLQTTVSRFLNCMPTWDQQTETTNGTCQIAQSTAKDNDPELDNRLLRQLKDDLILGSALKALEGVREAVLSSTSSSLSETLSFFMGPIKDLPISVDDIPANTKAQLLLSLRQAPQAFHGAAVFMSPIEGFHYASFFDKILVVFPVGFVLSYLYTVSRVIVALLMEKETKSRELMRILGVQETHILFAWFVTYLQLLLFASLLQTLGARALLFSNSNFALLFGFFFSFALSSFGYGFLVSSLFSRARAGSFVGMGVFFMMFFASFAFNESSGELQRTWACLLSPVALTQGINIITQVEAVGVGINGDNASELVGGFRFVNAIWMQIIDFFVYILVGLYFERVTPREFGVADKWYFCFTKAHWHRVLRSSMRASTTTLMMQYGTGDAASPEAAALAQGSCEPVSSEMKQQENDGRAVVIRNLRKEFDVPGGKKVAIKGLSLSFYEGQITCLLGHNGAGKTTLMAMLTGMVPPSSGDAWIRGHSVANDMPAVRKSLGYCPQHSVLYPELTVEEHLLFYGRVKGLYDPVTLNLEVSKKIDEVGLCEKRHVRSHALSGGMKRKLSLAIAFLGESRVVFLDEPTSGMDPYSRRSTWELIQSNRRARVLILTTHFMDEADILGDRIAIMAEGELKCVGSSLFLKNRFGVGYRLSFAQAQKANSVVLNNETGSSAEANVLQALIRRHVPEARADTDVGTELTFQLPFECAPRFPALFEEIESKQQTLGILSFAISVTTLEEIFLRVAEGKQPVHPITTSTAGLAPDTSEALTKSNHVQVSDASEGNEVLSYQNRSQNLGSRSSAGWFFVQIAALLRKRTLSARRDRNMLFFSTILPIVVVFVGLSALKVSLFIRNDPKAMLTSESQYDLGVATMVPYSCTPGSSSSLAIDPWCTAIVQPQHFAGGVPYALSLEPVVYESSTTPTVLNVSYTDPSIQPNDTTGFSLRFGELAFTKGYGHDSSTLTAQMTPIEGQNGGFVLYGSQEKQILGYNVMVNSSSTHGGPLYKAMVDEAIHRFLLLSSQSKGTSAAAVATTNRTLPTVRVGTHPFPLSFKTRSIFNSFLSLPAVIFVVIAFTFVPASMMPFLVKEKQREQNAKHQQLLSGVSLAAYWLANFVFDMTMYLVPMGTTILLLRSYGITSSLISSGSGGHASASVCQGCTREAPEAVLTLFILFGGAIAPWTYLMSHIMRDPGACLLYTIMLNFFLGLLLLITSYSLDSLTSTQEANQVLIYLWRCSPLFSLGNGLLRVIVADIEALYGLSRVTKSAFSPEVAGNEIAYLTAECPIFFILALVVDWVQTGDLRVNTGGQGSSVRSLLQSLHHLARRCRCRVNTKLHAQEHTQLVDADDEDVKAEAHRVLRANASPSEPSHSIAAGQAQESEEVVQLLNLQKTYPNGKKAISNLSFGLTRGDCFGFLGINGAGKTTTMKILTGDIRPSAGSAKLKGLDILTQRAKVRRCVGYCPQFDALLELLTVREHLEFYGRLKGFNNALLRNEVDRLLLKLQLKAFEGKLAGSLSGGNKRKLSVAIAMLGGPDLLFLDEPSTGMDPHARRFMWDVILQVSIQSKQTTVMLTTHSMEECEALCNKAAIMVGGRLRCFGSIPHLKARFGNGFLLECKLHCPTQEDILKLCETLTSTLTSTSSATGGGITSAQLPGLCTALGKPERIDWITGTSASQHPTGSMLQLQLLRKDREGGDGALDAREFCGWWLLEDRVQQLTAYLNSHFGVESTALLERQADFVRFKLANKQQISEPSSGDNSSKPVDNFRLSRMFKLVEMEKQRLCVQEYSISQTSLEQIFNSFARQQQEEIRVANGLFVD